MGQHNQIKNKDIAMQRIHSTILIYLMAVGLIGCSGGAPSTSVVEEKALGVNRTV